MGARVVEDEGLEAVLELEAAAEGMEGDGVGEGEVGDGEEGAAGQGDVGEGGGGRGGEVVV